MRARTNHSPRKGLGKAPNNLPVQLTSFIGREAELEEIKTSLRATRLLTLTGVGGCGKTRLALKVAAEVADAFPDGVWLVELASLSDAALVPQRVASALHLREEHGRTLTDVLVDFLRSRSMLLVLDNCEHLLSTCAHLATVLSRACPALAILTTSRERLGIEGETVWLVPPLSVPDRRRSLSIEVLERSEAARLFIERAKPTDRTFSVTKANAGALARVCERLDGIPLAIEMAAAWVKVLTVDQIASRLDDALGILTQGARTDFVHHQTLRATMDWSYDLLSAGEQAVFRRLSVFAGGCTLEGVQAVCSGGGVEPSDVLNVLLRLANKSLVVVEMGGKVARYDQLEIARQYGRERLVESEELESTRTRHRDWYLELAERAESELRGPNQDEWLETLDAEHDNVRAALAWSLADVRSEHRGTPDKADLGLRLVNALWWFWFIGGYFSEGRRWIEQMLAASEGASPSLRARALSGRGTLTLMLGDLGTATALLEEGLSMSKTADDPLGIAWGTALLGTATNYSGDNARAVTLWQESLAQWRRLGNAWGIAFATGALGIALADQGDTEHGLPLLKEAVTLSRVVAEKWVTALMLNYLAGWILGQGEIEEALPLVEESVSLFRQLGDRRGTARALGNFGRIARAHDQLGRASELFQESLALFREIGDRRGIALSLGRLAGIALANGQLQQAARLFAAADVLREATRTAPAGSHREVFEFASIDDDMTALRSKLGEQAFGAAWARGRLMTLEQAIEDARSVEPPRLDEKEPISKEPSDPLTRREREVASLVAQGRSNREIGATLFISERTADRHVENILNKLGFGSRTQIATWIVQHGADGAPTKT